MVKRRDLVKEVEAQGLKNYGGEPRYLQETGIHDIDPTAQGNRRKHGEGDQEASGHRGKTLAWFENGRN